MKRKFSTKYYLERSLPVSLANTLKRSIIEAVTRRININQTKL